MKTKTKRTLSAWTLLSIFVSMMMLSGLHRHHIDADVAADCVECAHHVHHGHLSAASEHPDECLLCQFISFTYIAATAILLVLPALTTATTLLCQSVLRSLFVSGNKSSRAPPYVLND